MYKTMISAGLLALACIGNANAQNSTAADIAITKSYAIATVPGQSTGGAYLTIQNKGSQPHELVSASSPAAGSVEIHEMSMEGGVMRMRAIDSLNVAPGKEVAMAPGNGAHLMLLKLKQPLKAGATVPLKLDFKDGQDMQITLTVQPMNMAATPAMHMH